MMGIAYTQSSTFYGVPSYFDQLNAEGVIAETFDMCVTVNSNRQGGLFVFPNEQSVEPSHDVFSMTPIIHKDFYTVEILDLTVSGRRLHANATYMNAGECIVDSGTSFTYIPTRTWHKMTHAYIERVDNRDVRVATRLLNGDAVEVSAAVRKRLPPLSLLFQGGGELDVNADEYLVPQSTRDDDMFYFPILEGAVEDGLIVGASLMASQRVRFADRLSENAAVGFTPRRDLCPSSRSSSSSSASAASEVPVKARLHVATLRRDASRHAQRRLRRARRQSKRSGRVFTV
jgi:hypothetical protein